MLHQLYMEFEGLQSMGVMKQSIKSDAEHSTPQDDQCVQTCMWHNLLFLCDPVPCRSELEEPQPLNQYLESELEIVTPALQESQNETRLHGLFDGMDDNFFG